MEERLYNTVTPFKAQLLLTKLFIVITTFLLNNKGKLVSCSFKKKKKFGIQLLTSKWVLTWEYVLKIINACFVYIFVTFSLSFIIII